MQTYMCGLCVSFYGQVTRFELCKRPVGQDLLRTCVQSNIQGVCKDPSVICRQGRVPRLVHVEAWSCEVPLPLRT